MQQAVMQRHVMHHLAMLLRVILPRVMLLPVTQSRATLQLSLGWKPLNRRGEIFGWISPRFFSV